MDLQQTKILLEKINTLYKSIGLDEGAIASIERDLMLSYIRQLYQSFLDVDATPETTTRSKSKPSVKSNNAPELEIVNPEPEPPKKQYSPPRIIEIPDSIRDMESTSARPATPAPPPPKPKPEPRPEPKPSPEPVAPQPETKNTASNARVESLFKMGAAKELSDKLSLQPVSDLNKAMAINDRLLYTNDLFDKNKNAMDNALKLLNQFPSMAEAKSLLVNLANQYDWMDEEKVETAQAFIKLVNRRYA
ncbi:MAG: hypothetical protein DHS20C18_13340 [Saprospiraceae bacterium]|nr:MAG: hypothetical protein DHS20C18_13340 [Saprospiraceae bacterium]